MPTLKTLAACLAVMATVGAAGYVLAGWPVWLGAAGTLLIGLAWPT